MCMCIDADSPGMAEIISRADDVLEGRLYFTKIWDMERCETPYKVDFSKCLRNGKWFQTETQSGASCSIAWITLMTFA